MTTEISDEIIKERLKAQNAALGVVLDNRSLHAGMLNLISRTEQVICDLAIDDSTVVVVELSLFSEVSLVTSSRWNLPKASLYLTLRHLPSVP